MDRTNPINLVTWNATGLMSSAGYLCKVLQSHEIDFCGVAEHWLSSNSSNFINSLSSNYNSIVVIDNNYKNRNSKMGRGGVALMWNRKHDNNVSQLFIDDDRIAGIQFDVNDGSFLFIFQVYLPCTNYPASFYKQYIEKLYNIWSTYSSHGSVIFMGDFNAKFLGNVKSVRQRDRQFTQFMADTGLLACNTLPLCTGASSSFVSYDKKSEALIDHICIPVEKEYYIQSCEILDDDCLNVSNHRPIVLKILLHTSVASFGTSDNSNFDQTKQINWSKVTSEELNNYKTTLNDSETLLCARFQPICSEADIDKVYDIIVDEISRASNVCIKERKFKHFLKPYWNDSLKELHLTLKQHRRFWVEAGKPRGNEKSHTDYKDAKRKFRCYHRQRVREFMAEQNAHLDKCAEFDQAQFWRLVKQKRCNDGKSGCELKFGDSIYRDAKEITQQWKLYFEKLYTPSNNDNFDQIWERCVNVKINELKSRLSEIPPHDVKINPEDVIIQLKLCKKGKMCGLDNVFYEHLIHGGSTLSQVLARLYSAILRYGYIPPKMNRGVIVTLHKGGGKRKDDPNNYRAISLTSAILKLFESVLLQRFENKILSNLSIQQGGFQRNLGCIMTSFSLKESILYAKENNSKLFVAFLDCRQAFDKVWHNGLFLKLLNVGVDLYTLKTLFSLYSNMHSCIRHKSFLSDWFQVKQGTRQGGKSSPLLYLLFIDGLIKKLEESKLGICVYGLDYCSPTVADDMILASYSKRGLDRMLLF